MAKRVKVSIIRKDKDPEGKANVLVWVGDSERLEIGFGGPTWLIVNERMSSAQNGRLLSRFLVPTNAVDQVTITDEPEG